MGVSMSDAILIGYNEIDMQKQQLFTHSNILKAFKSCFDLFQEHVLMEPSD